MRLTALLFCLLVPGLAPAQPRHCITHISATAMTADITPQWVELGGFSEFSVQAVWTGTPAGNLILHATNDGTTVSTIPGSTVAAGGAAGDQMWNVSTAGYGQVRLFYDFSSSTGSLTATVCRR